MLGLMLLPLLLLRSSLALNNGLARTPPMGYNTWYDWGGGHRLNETSILATAHALVSTGLRDAGYRSLNFDDGFIAPKNKSSLLPDPGGRLPNGSLYANPVKFPRGFAALSRDITRLGLQFGVYTARGRLTCCGLAGSLGHEAEDMRRFAVDWNASYVKADSCHGVPSDPPGSKPGTAAIWQYGNMSDGLNRTGRRVILDACWDACWPPASCLAAGLPPLMDERRHVANSWRIGPDGVSWGRRSVIFVFRLII